MTHGVLGIICCPMVEDNLIYSLTRDPEEKFIHLVSNGNESSVRRKMDKARIPYGMIGWQDVIQRTLKLGNGYNMVVYMLPLGLHAEPKVLRTTVEDLTKQMQPLVDCMGFYLGMCGNNGWNMSEWCRDNGYKPGYTFCDRDGNMCHDCVGINIAGGPKYVDLERKYTGHLFMFPAMATNYDDFMNADKAESMRLEQSITDEMREELGIEPGPDGYMRWLLRMGEYKYILKLDTGIGDRENFESNLQQVSERTGLTIREAEDGWADLQPTEDIYRRCKEALPR